MSDEKKLIVKLNEKPFKDGEIAPDKDAVLITDGADSDKLKRVLLENLVAGGGGGDGTSWEFINFDPNIGKEGTPQDPDPYIPENEDTIAAVRLTPDDKGGTLYKFNPLGDGTPFNPYWHHLFDISVESGTTWEVVAFDPNDQDGQGNHYVPGNEDTIVFVDPVIGTLYDGNVYKYNPDDGAHGKPFWTLLFNVNSGGAGGAPLIFGFGDPNDKPVAGNDGDIFVDKDSGNFYKYDEVGSLWEIQFNSAESLWRFQESDPDEYAQPPQKEEELWFNTTNGKLFKYDFTGGEWENIYTFNTDGGGGDFNLEGATINGKGIALDDAGTLGTGLAIGMGSVTASYASFANGVSSSAGRIIEFVDPTELDHQNPPATFDVKLSPSFTDKYIDETKDLFISYSGKSIVELRTLEAGTYTVIEVENEWFLRVDYDPGFRVKRWRGLFYNILNPDVPDFLGADFASGFENNASGGASQAVGVFSNSKHLSSFTAGFGGHSLWPVSAQFSGGLTQTTLLNVSCETKDDSPVPLAIYIPRLGERTLWLEKKGIYRFKGSVIAVEESISTYNVDILVIINPDESTPLKYVKTEEVEDPLTLGDTPFSTTEVILPVAGDDFPSLRIMCKGIANKEIFWSGSFQVHTILFDNFDEGDD